jgi:2-succinyl-5-enolpyruvyl-6-hydroxy-3-cyclohexene-1-carboxylate synthase
LQPDASLNEILGKISADERVAVVTETTSNLYHPSFITGTDQVISTILPEEEELFRCDLLITLGDQLISKMVKAWVRKHPPCHHWHFGEAHLSPDAFRSLTWSVGCDPVWLLERLPVSTATAAGYGKIWWHRYGRSMERHDRFVNSIGYSDLLVFSRLVRKIPSGTNVQMGNSTPVRYFQLFPPIPGVGYNSNRGTSGIDGCTSTAAGAAFFHPNLTLLVSGDLSFMYDSNALWSGYLKPNLRIIVINNSGGGIFRFIDGPSGLPELENYFEARHNLDVCQVVRSFGINCSQVDQPDALDQALESLMMAGDEPKVLEIKTPADINGILLKEYFNFLRDGR